MTLLEIQSLSQNSNLPTEAQFQYWVDHVLSVLPQEFEIVIRIVDESESAALNQQYRHKKGATNILSFPFEIPEHIPMNLLGDLVICAPVIEREALAQHKVLLDHWAHIVIHGVLHLLGYDHLEPEEAEEMEAKEIALLKTININNPYQDI